MPAKKTTVVAADDDPQLLRLVTRNLQMDGYEVIAASDGQQALELIEAHMPDLVLLDLMMPKLDGFAVCQRVREFSNLPIIILTARGADQDKIRGLDLGADDYLTKPFSVEELLARVHAVLRRSAPDEAREGVLRVADLELDENSHEVTRAGQEIHLTATEFELLRYLMRNERMVLSKAQILDRVWKYDFQGQSNIVELYIGYLRKKVDAVDPKLIHTVRGAGYVIKAPRA
jgi:two-component system OmpR family response regulator